MRGMPTMVGKSQRETRQETGGHRNQARGYRRGRIRSYCLYDGGLILLILGGFFLFESARALVLPTRLIVPRRQSPIDTGSSTGGGLFPRRSQLPSALTIQRMVLTTPESIIEKASTEKLLDDLIDESVRTTPRRPIMMQFDPSSGWIWKRWTGTVFSETWDSCLSRMIYAMVVLFLCRTIPAIERQLTGIHILWGQLLSVTTFTLTFFVNQSYALWRQCYAHSRRLQGRLHDIGLTLAAHAARKAPSSPNEPSTYTAAARQELELVSRYVRLFNILTYASFTRSHRPILTPRGMRRLVERGLVTASEREVLVDAELPATQRHNAVLLWITRAFIEGWEAGHYVGHDGFEAQIMDKIHVCRAQYGAIGDELAGRMPLAYAHIVQVLVDVILWLYPFMAISSKMSGLLAILGTGLLTASYQGLFQLAKQFLDPYDNESYGKGEDPFVVDTLIAETNAGSVRWMHGLEQFPVSPQRMKDGELSDFLLPQRGYSVEELETMEQERLIRERELQERREKEEAERKLAEERAAELQRAAEAMTPALVDLDTLQSPLEEVTSLALVNDRVTAFRAPSGMLSTSLDEGQSVANIVHNMNDLAGGMPASLVPEGTAVAVEEKSTGKDNVEKGTTNDDRHDFDPDDEEEDDDDDDDDLDWVDSDTGLEENYVHSFSSFDLYKDLPWFDEVGPDGQEVRLSQMLADEVWEEELEVLREKEAERINSLEEYTRKVAEMEKDASQELAETRSVLEAMPGAEIGTIPIRSNKDEEPKYDQTKLDGISQLWGMPPGELSELQSYEEPPIPPGEDSFDGIAQLYGAGASSTPSSPANDDEDLSSFSGISMLWGDPATNDLDDSDLSSSATRPIRGGTRSMRYEDADAWAQSPPPAGKEVRMSQILADEVWVEELENSEPPDVAQESYEDVVKHEAEMLEAEKEERLETEAILNAPSFAEYLGVDDDDSGSKALKAANSTTDTDELAILEMDLPEETPTIEPADMSAQEKGLAEAPAEEPTPKTPVVTNASLEYLTQISKSTDSSEVEARDDGVQSPLSSPSPSQQQTSDSDVVAAEDSSSTPIDTNNDEAIESGNEQKSLIIDEAPDQPNSTNEQGKSGDATDDVDDDASNDKDNKNPNSSDPT